MLFIIFEPYSENNATENGGHKKIGNFTTRIVNDGLQSEIYACACIEIIANREKKTALNKCVTTVSWYRIERKKK